MAGIENSIFRILEDRDTYHEYREHLPEETFSPVSRRLLGYIDTYWQRYPEERIIEWESFGEWLSNYAASKDTHLDAMVQLCTTTAKVEAREPARDILNRAVEQDIAEQIEGHIEKDGEINPTYIRGLVEKLEVFKSSDLSASEYEVDTDIENVLRNSHITDEGLEFSLEILQRSVGPLRPGDTMYVVKRPEVGGTSFLVHQTGHMMRNSPESTAVIFSNEEDGNRVMIRLYQSVLGWTTKDILADPAKAKSEYESIMGSLDRIRIVHTSQLHRKDCERAIERYNPDLIVFNMLSKISGFGSSRVQNDVDIYSNQGMWMRELANSYNCAAMTAWQAGGQAHGKAWLETDDMYMSKTGLPAEADLILGIGKVIDTSVPENHRYLHLSKNKLPGSSTTEEALRHGYFDGIYLDTQTGRYYE